MCLFTCSWLWVIPLPVSDPSLLPLIVASVGQWCSRYFGLSWVPFLGWADVCVLRSSGKLSHTTRRNAIIWGRQFPHIQEPDWLHFLLKLCVSLCECTQRALGLQEAASCPVWMVGTELQSSATQRALLHGAIAPASRLSFYSFYIKCSFFLLPCEFNSFSL